MSETTAGGVTNEPQKSGFTSGREVSLGLGSLIFIAMIVIIFGGGGSSSLKNEMQSLRSEVTELKKY